MGWKQWLKPVADVLSTRLFELGGARVTLATVVTIILILVATVWVSRAAQRGVRRLLRLRGIDNEGAVAAAGRLVHYALLLGGVGVAFSAAGIDLGALFAAGAIFAVGVGVAMQSIAQNFVSGVILLAEHTIKPGDVLEVEGQVVRVISMRIRSTVVRTRDEEEMIVPNATLVQSTVKNYTLHDSMYRVRVAVGVVYSSDMKRVQEVLSGAANAIPWRLPDYSPRVLMWAFGDSSVEFEVCVWVADPWVARQYRSDLNQAIWWALRDAGITIAFPQLDVHFDPPVTAALSGPRSAA